MKTFDLLVLGGGPGGMTAALYASRALFKVAVIEKMMFGGQMMTTDWIDNYPGFENGVSGFDLSQQMEKQALRFGTEIINGTIEEVDLESTPKVVRTSTEEYYAKSIIISTGTEPRMLGIPGEKEYKGRGVSYCGTCDAPFFKDKDIIVVGGGSTSMQEALHLAKFAKSIKLIVRRPVVEELKAERILIDKVQHADNIELMLHRRLVEVQGAMKVTGVVVEHIGTGDKETISLDGVFVFIGVEPNTDFLKDSLKLSDDRAVITNVDMETGLKGVYAVGDVRDKAVRQIASAVGDGAVAAHFVQHYIEKLVVNEE
ncbi:thioredoxin-disulfide reductase [bacterium]|nr:thioredoxin-disulfide reductase [bacterium]